MNSIRVIVLALLLSSFSGEVLAVADDPCPTRPPRWWFPTWVKVNQAGLKQALPSVAGKGHTPRRKGQRRGGPRKQPRCSS